MLLSVRKYLFFSIILLLRVPPVQGADQRVILLDMSHGQSDYLITRSAQTAASVNDSIEVRSDEVHTGSDSVESASPFEVLLKKEFGHTVRSLRDGFLLEEKTFHQPVLPALLIISAPQAAIDFEERHVLVNYLRNGGSILLVAGVCLEERDNRSEVEIFNDLIEGLADAGLEPGFRFEDTIHPPQDGRVSSSFSDDPIVLGRHGEVSTLDLPTGYELQIDSFLNPSARAFAIELPSGGKWPFLAASVVGHGKIAAFGVGDVLLSCSRTGEEDGVQADREAVTLFSNLVSWLLGEREATRISAEERPAILVNELMWGGEASHEYIELYNPSEREINLEGWILTDGEDVYLLKGAVAAGGYYLLEYNEEATPVMADEVYGDDSAFLVFDDSGDRLSLLDRWGDVVAMVNRDETSWPAGLAGGSGASMELITDNGDYGAFNWRTSVGGKVVPYGTPRAVNSTKVITPFVPDFRASITGGNILLEWKIDRSVKVSGFNLYRSVDVSLNPLEATGTFTRLNTLMIPPDSTSFIDSVIDSSLTYHYLLGVVSENENEKYAQPVTISLKGFEDPKRYSVSMDQNFPNPFNPNTEIRFEIEDMEGTGDPIEIQVSIFSPRGHMVKRLFEKEAYPGSFSVRWDGRDDNGEEVGSGAYYYQLLVRDSESGQILVKLSRKMVLMR